MFNKIKALKDVRSQAKQIEKALEGVSASSTSKGLKLTVNGKQEITSIDIPEDLDRSDIGDAVKKAHNDAMKDVQKEVQKAIKDMGGLPDMSQFGM